MPSTKPVFNLILLGDPGAGKATQSAYFAKKYKMYDFDMGKELTLLREQNESVEKAQRKTADKGILTPTSIVRKINREKLTAVKQSQGILFDGHPKMVGEAKLIAKILDDSKRMKPLVLYIQIPTAEIVRRVRGRKGYFNTKYSKRSDDTMAGLKNRAKYYRTNIADVLAFFKTKYTVAQIDGMGTKSEVRSRIEQAINFYLKHYEEIYQDTR